MAKERLVTRSFISTRYEVIGVDVEYPEATVTRYFEFEGSPNYNKALDLIKERCVGDTFHPSFIKNVEQAERVLGVPVTYFLEHGVPVERPESQKKESRNKRSLNTKHNQEKENKP